MSGCCLGVVWLLLGPDAAVAGACCSPRCGSFFPHCGFGQDHLRPAPLRLVLPPSTGLAGVMHGVQQDQRLHLGHRSMGRPAAFELHPMQTWPAATVALARDAATAAC
jgi:hypothetical protein